MIALAFAFAYVATLLVYVGVGVVLFVAGNQDPNSTPRQAVLDGASWPALAFKRLWTKD